MSKAKDQFGCTTVKAAWEDYERNAMIPLSATVIARLAFIAGAAWTTRRVQKLAAKMIDSVELEMPKASASAAPFNHLTHGICPDCGGEYGHKPHCQRMSKSRLKRLEAQGAAPSAKAPGEMPEEPEELKRFLETRAPNDIADY